MKNFDFINNPYYSIFAAWIIIIIIAVIGPLILFIPMILLSGSGIKIALFFCFTISVAVIIISSIVCGILALLIRLTIGKHYPESNETIINSKKDEKINNQKGELTVYNTDLIGQISINENDDKGNLSNIE